MSFVILAYFGELELPSLSLFTNQRQGLQGFLVKKDKFAVRPQFFANPSKEVLPIRAGVDSKSHG